MANNPFEPVDETFARSYSVMAANPATGEFDMPAFTPVENQHEKTGDAVNHPSHYNTGKIEVIDVIEDWKLGFHLGNAVKYIARAGVKDPAKEKEDLEKAIWYIRRHIDSIIGGSAA